MALSHQQHHSITASRPDHSRVAATLFPQGLQGWALTHTRETQLSFSFGFSLNHKAINGHLKQVYLSIKPHIESEIENHSRIEQ